MRDANDGRSRAQLLNGDPYRGWNPPSDQYPANYLAIPLSALTADEIPAAVAESAVTVNGYMADDGSYVDGPMVFADDILAALTDDAGGTDGE